MATLKKGFALTLALLCACGDGGARSASGGGTLVISTGGDPDVLVPALAGRIQSAQIVDLVYDRLAEIGDSLNTLGDAGFQPRLADRWTWAKDSLSIAFHLNPAAKWHDGQPVRSNDVRFTLMTTKDSTLGSSNAALITNIDSVSTPDSSTAVFWYHARDPQQFYDAVFQLPIIPEHIWKSLPLAAWRTSEVARHPIGSGQYRFNRWTPRAVVELVADSGNYRGTPKLSRVIWTIAPDFQTAVTKFLTGESDFFEQLRPENIPEVGKHPELKTKSYKSLGYSFAQFNLRDPVDHDRPHRLFGDRNLRRALTMAVDRNSIVRSTYGSMALPALGPTARAYPTTDANLQQIPFDLAKARALLDSLGWRIDPSDGVRKRSGRPLEFGLSVPATSTPRVRMAVLIQEQLRQAGVKVNVEQLEFPTLSDKLQKRSFDVVIAQLSTNPSPGSVRGSWGSAGSRAANSNNVGSYANPAFDALVDTALASFDGAKRKSYFTRAYETIIADAPAIWLAEPLGTVGYHSRLQLATLRPDAWWAHIGEWWIPQDKRIPRDNVPANATAGGDSAANKAP